MARVGRRPRKADPVWEGYRRAKRSVHPWPLKIGMKVLYEDEQGRVHRRAFEVFAMERDQRAVIKGWPDGVVRRGPMKMLLVSRAALVPYLHVQSETFKAAFGGVPEETKCTRYDHILIGIRKKKGATR